MRRRPGDTLCRRIVLFFLTPFQGRRVSRGWIARFAARPPLVVRIERSDVRDVHQVMIGCGHGCSPRGFLMTLNEDFTSRGKLADIGRWYVTQVVKSIAASLPKDTAVLDAGAGECAYKRFFSHCKYQAIDSAVGESRWNYSNLDYVAPLHQMPIADGVFDIVLCTQVLEHLEWPRESVKEMHRVLKPQGKLFITVPMAQAEHQIPFDFFRYTSYGLKSICSGAGFDHIDVQPLGGFFVRWAYELPRALSILPSAGLRSRKPNIAGIVLLPLKILLLLVVRVLQILLLCLDPLDRAKNFPFGWSCTATKP